ncbi:MAG TPA: RidA family protein [Flavobacterium sp.]
MEELKNLKKLGFSLPEASVPGGSYCSLNIRGTVAYVAVQFSIENGKYHFQGRFGDKLSTSDGRKAAELCVLNVLSQIQKNVGFKNVVGLNHFDLYYQATGDWDEGPVVADAASELFVAVLGEKGMHSRSIFGVERLPRNFCVGLSATFTVVR